MLSLMQAMQKIMTGKVVWDYEIPDDVVLVMKLGAKRGELRRHSQNQIVIFQFCCAGNNF